MKDWMLLMLSILTMMWILIEVSEGCAVKTKLPIQEVLKENEKSPWLVVIGNVRKQEYGHLKGVSYGAIIHPELVISSAAAVSKVATKSLVVFSNCRVKFGTHCDTRTVATLLDPPYVVKNDVKERDPVILLVDKPFELNKRVNIIRVPGKNENFDRNDCLIHHWSPMVSTYGAEKMKNYKRGLLNAEYHVSLASDTFGMNEEEKAKMIEDVDCVLEDCVPVGAATELEDIANKINFMGSPIACRLTDSDEDQRVLVGFSTYLYFSFPHEKAVKYGRGTLVEFTSDIPDFIDPIISTLS